MASQNSSEPGLRLMLPGGRDLRSSLYLLTRVAVGQGVRRNSSSMHDIVLMFCSVETESADSFPFVGAVPHRDGHFIAAGFVGHGKQCQQK